MSSNKARTRWMARVLAVFVLMLSAASGAFAQVESLCGPMDVVFVIDNTGSMAQVNDEIQDQVNVIADSVVIASGGDYQFGLVSLPENDVRVLLDMAPANRSDLANATAELDNLGSCGGAVGWDEGLNTVINRLGPRTGASGEQIGTFSGSFRPGATKIIIVITDTTPSGFECELVEGIHDENVAELAAQAAAMGIGITGINVPTGGGSDPIRTAELLQEAANISGGLYREAAADASDLGDVIVDVIEDCGGLSSRALTLAIEPNEVAISPGETMEFTVVNYTPGNLPTLFYNASGLPDGSVVTFTPQTPKKEGTDQQLMRITLSPTAEVHPMYILNVFARHSDQQRFDSAYALLYTDCRAPAILGTDQPLSQTVPFGGSVTVSAKAYGSGLFTYQWYEGFSGMTGSPIAGATSSTYRTPAITAMKPVWVRVTNVCGTYDSMTAFISPQ